MSSSDNTAIHYPQVNSYFISAQSGVHYGYKIDLQNCDAYIVIIQVIQC